MPSSFRCNHLVECQGLHVNVVSFTLWAFICDLDSDCVLVWICIAAPLHETNMSDWMHHRSTAAILMRIGQCSNWLWCNLCKTHVLYSKVCGTAMHIDCLILTLNCPLLFMHWISKHSPQPLAGPALKKRFWVDKAATLQKGYCSWFKAPYPQLPYSQTTAHSTVVQLEHAYNRSMLKCHVKHDQEA